MTHCPGQTSECNERKFYEDGIKWRVIDDVHWTCPLRNTCIRYLVKSEDTMTVPKRALENDCPAYEPSLPPAA